MNSLLWIAQSLLAAIFLATGLGKMFAYKRVMSAVESRSKGRPTGISREMAFFMGMAEVVAALGVLTPAIPASSRLHAYPVVLPAAGGLALLMVLAGIYHLRRHESIVHSVVLFLLAVFVMAGRWAWG
ncbi:MAG: DoxX family protein [Terracidiphilus sp.]